MLAISIANIPGFMLTTKSKISISAIVSASAISIALTAAVSPASSATISYTGNTAGQPTWNRTTTGSPPSSLSSVGTAVNYSVQSFTLDTAGLYSFLNSASYDAYAHLYQNSFNPLAQFTNVLIADDDSAGRTDSAFSYNLTTGVNYLFVSSAFSNGNSGAFTATIIGPGNISLAGAPTSVPEPFTVIGSLIGGSAALRMRRKLSRSSQKNSL
jgi:hypothetical protein